MLIESRNHFNELRVRDEKQLISVMGSDLRQNATLKREFQKFLLAEYRERQTGEQGKSERKATSWTPSPDAVQYLAFNQFYVSDQPFRSEIGFCLAKRTKVQPNCTRCSARLEIAAKTCYHLPIAANRGHITSFKRKDS